MDAAEIARLRDRCGANGAHFDGPTVLALLDDLEQARKERDEESKEVTNAQWALRRAEERADDMAAQRDQAQQSAKDARALEREADAVFLETEASCEGNDDTAYTLRRAAQAIRERKAIDGVSWTARIEAMLEQKP